MRRLDPAVARLEWADRLRKQAGEMRLLAAGSTDPIMQRELIGYARQMSEQATRLLTLPNDSAD